MGQYPFRPPSVAGWDWGTSWLSSNAMRVRFDFANYMIDTPRVGVEDGSTPNKLSPKQAVARARRAVGAHGERQPHRARRVGVAHVERARFGRQGDAVGP